MKKQLENQASTTFTNRANIETSQASCLRCSTILFTRGGHINRVANTICLKKKLQCF